MIPLLIGPLEKEKLAAMKAYALAHPINRETCQSLAEEKHESQPLYIHPMGHYIDLPICFEVGLTYEQQVKHLWHFSMSIKVEGRLPHPSAVEMVLAELGLPMLDQNVHIRQFGKVINIWFLAEPVQN